MTMMALSSRKSSVVNFKPYVAPRTQDVAESLMQDDLVYSKTQVEYDKKYQEYLKYIAPDNAISTEDEDFSNPNPNPSPLNQSNWQDLTMVIPDMLSERQKRIKVCLVTIVICNHITNLKQQPRRRHRKRNKFLTQHHRDNGLKWMDGMIFHFFNLIFIFRSLDVL